MLIIKDSVQWKLFVHRCSIFFSHMIVHAELSCLTFWTIWRHSNKLSMDIINYIFLLSTFFYFVFSNRIKKYNSQLYTETKKVWNKFFYKNNLMWLFIESSYQIYHFFISFLSDKTRNHFLFNPFNRFNHRIKRLIVIDPYNTHTWYPRGYQVDHLRVKCGHYVDMGWISVDTTSYPRRKVRFG